MSGKKATPDLAMRAYGVFREWGWKLPTGAAGLTRQDLRQLARQGLVKGALSKLPIGVDRQRLGLDGAEMTPKAADAQDFRNCGWAIPAKNIQLTWECKRKKMRLEVRDLKIGLCPCKYWVMRGKITKKSEKTGPEPEKSLF